METLIKDDFRSKQVGYDIYFQDKEFLEPFLPKNINIEVDYLTEQEVIGVNRDNQILMQKIYTDNTKEFLDNITQLRKQLASIEINVKGEKRSGKSLIALKINNLISFTYKDNPKQFKYFKPKDFVCSSQMEFRQKVINAKQGDFFQIDENVIEDYGSGSNAEMSQLKNIQNIIAKENIHTNYLTPKKFMRTGAGQGLSYFGRDNNNFVSRFLWYKLNEESYNTLIGYVLFDVGSLFRDYSCFLYKETGGCTNPKLKTYEELSQENIKRSYCIPKDYDVQKVKDKEKYCPFYDVCMHPLLEYEHKKDDWIKGTKEGEMSARDILKNHTAIKLLRYVGYKNEVMEIKLRGKNQKQLANLIKRKLKKIGSTKFTLTEEKEVLSLLYDSTDLLNLKNMCHETNLNFKEEFNNIPNKDDLVQIEDEERKELYGELGLDFDSIISKQNEKKVNELEAKGRKK